MPPCSQAAPTARLCDRPSRPASAAKQRAPWANPDPATLLALCQQVPHRAPLMDHTWSSQGTSPLFGELCTCICSHVAGGKTEKSLTTHELRWFPPQPPPLTGPQYHSAETAFSSCVSFIKVCHQEMTTVCHQNRDCSQDSGLTLEWGGQSNTCFSAKEAPETRPRGDRRKQWVGECGVPQKGGGDRLVGSHWLL